MRGNARFDGMRDPPARLKTGGTDDKKHSLKKKGGNDESR